MGPISGLGREFDEALKSIISHRVQNESRVDEKLLEFEKRIARLERIIEYNTGIVP